MPKDAPRKFKPAAPNPNKPKVADFSKTKVKLGKGKQVANNATDTSYKARSIALPNQTIGVVRDEGERLTKGGKSWDELRVGARHYNVAIRRDSLLGMKELLLAHADVRTAQFPSLMQTVCKTLTDGEASVRTLLPALLAAVLPLVPTSTLGPHLPTLLLHATSALSSIFPAVRVDAVRVLGVLLDEGSDDGRDKITDGWETGAGGRGEGGRVLEGLLAVLGVGGKGETAGSNAPLGTASKLVVFQALLRFLTHALSDRALAQSTADRPPSLAFLSASFATPHAFDQFATALAPAPAGVRPGGKGKARAGEWAVGLSGWERGDLELEGAGGEVDKGRKITDLYLALHPLLLSTFLDSAPSVFSPSASLQPAASSSSLDSHLQTLSSILAFSALLGLTAVRGPPNAQTPALRQALELLLKHMRPYFPFSDQAHAVRSGRDEALLVRMELDYASLTSLLAPGASATAVAIRTKADGPKERARAVEDAFRRARRGVSAGKRKGVEEVAQWVAALLAGERATQASPLGVSVSRESYAALRECVWALLSLPPPKVKKGAAAAAAAAADDEDDDGEQTDVPGLIWAALVDHYLRLSSVDPVKKLALEFIGRLCLLETEPLYTGLFRLNDASRQRVASFYASLPRMLWELRSKDLACTTTLLRLLHALLLSSLTSAPITPVLLASLPPYFHSTHPTRGDVLGPWAALPDADVRRLALDVSRTALEGAGADDEAGSRLREAVGKAVAGREEVSVYWAGATGGQ